MLDPRTVARSFQDFSRAPFTRIPQAAREAWLRALSQLHATLDLPSRRELSDLTARLEALDARIAALVAGQSPAASLPAAEPAAAPAVEAAPVEAAPVEAAASEAPTAAVASDDDDSDDSADDDGADDAEAATDAAAAGTAPTGGPRKNRKHRKTNRR